LSDGASGAWFLTHPRPPGSCASFAVRATSAWRVPQQQLYTAEPQVEVVPLPSADTITMPEWQIKKD